MARDEAPPFARGETWYNGGTIDTTNLGGINLEGKEYVFEPNSQDNYSGSYSNPNQDTSGRPIRVKVVRNAASVNLKGARVAHFWAASTQPTPYETRVDGYCFAAGDRPAGVVDEFLPPAGVPPNDLFYLVIDGPTSVTNTTTATTVNYADRIVPAVSGASAGDDLAGRVATQNVATAATATEALAIEEQIGYAASANAVNNGAFYAVIHLGHGK